MLGITPEILEVARSMGITKDEVEAILRTLQTPQEFYQEWMGLPYESQADKAKRMVVLDNRPSNDPGHPRFKGHHRGTPRRQRDYLPECERTDVSTGISLTRVGEDRLAARVCDDAHRIVSEHKSD
jgi:hypothetical protein